MHHQRGFISVLLILLVILAAVGGLFYYGVVNGNLLKTTDPNLDTTRKFDEQMKGPSITSSAVDTSNWKTYTSSYGYSIQYPPEGKFMDANGHANFEFQYQDADILITGLPSGIPNLTPFPNDYNTYGFCKPESTEFKEKATINGIEFYRSHNYYGGGSICLEAITKIKKSDVNSYWTFSLQAKANNKEGVQLFDHILSTFKFIDQTSMCKPKFAYSTNTSELTAEATYAQKCLEVQTKTACEKVDIYRASTKNFGNSDGIPDCEWTSQ